MSDHKPKRDGKKSAGYPHGERHHNARLSDAEVVEVRSLRHIHGYGYGALADLFGVPERTIKALCRFERRARGT